MTKKNEDHIPLHLSTSLLMIQNSATLQDMLTQHSLQTKEKTEADRPGESDTETADPTEFATLLEPGKLADILKGPYASFIRLCIHTYATLTYLKHQLVIQAESVFEESKLATDNVKLLTKAQLKKISVSEIERSMDSFDKLIVELNNEWRNQLDQWLTKATVTLKEQHCELGSNQTEELMLYYPYEELMDRLLHLKIEPIIPKKQAPFSFSIYLRNKIRIAIQNQLLQVQEMDLKTKTKSVEKELAAFF